MDELRASALGTMLDPAVWAQALVVVGLCWVSGRLSLRELRRLPDFGHKQEYAHGAHWAWLGLLVLFAVPYAVAYAMLNYTDYVVSGLLVAGLAGAAAAHVAAERLGWHLVGVVFWMVRLNMMAKGKTDEDLIEQTGRPPVRRERVCMRITRVVGPITPLFLLYAILSTTYPLDRMAIDQAYAEGIGAEISRAVASPAVAETNCFAPMGMIGRGDPLLSPRSALESIRQILGIWARPEPASVWECYSAHIRLSPAATPTQAQDALARCKRALAHEQAKRYWWIRVRGGDPPVTLKTVWPHEPTQGIADQPPSTR